MITKEILLNLIKNNYDIYELSDYFKIDHKKIRSLLILYEIKLPNNKYTHHLHSYIEPNNDELFSKSSIVSHSLYLCEGWHTEKTNHLSFANQNIELVKIFCNCIFNIYKYNKPILITIFYNFNDLESVQKAELYLKEFNDSTKYNVKICQDQNRKNPIIRTRIGGKNFARLFIENGYKILNQVNN